MEHFGTQISGSSCSPSFRSEPPDIRNWFSSYEYESFVLDTNDTHADSSAESKDDKDRFVNEKIDRRRGNDWTKYRELRNRDEMNVNDDVSSYKFIERNSFSEVNKHEDQNLSKVPDALLSSSILSEPPDIRSWFSSNEYQSPVFDTGDCFDSYASNKSFSEEEEVVGKCQGNKEENLRELRKSRYCHEEGSGQVDPLNAIVLPKTDLESLHSVSLLSEPPDIRNWFSSYDYESPGLSMPDDIGHSYGDMKKEHNLWIARKARNDNGAIGDKLRSYALEENISITEDRDRCEEKEKLCSLNDLCFEQRLEHKSFGSKAIEEPSLTDEELLGGEEQQKFVQEADLKSTNTCGIAGSTDKKLLKNLIDSRQFTKEKNLEGKVCTEGDHKPKRGPSKSSVTRFSIGKSNYEVSDKENNREENVDRGKNRIEDAKSLRRPEEMIVECSRSNVLVRSGGVKDNAVKRRKSLAETTNFQDSVAVEITGKWMCPQKNKQKNGPPLKQLRLEQWLNRV